MSVSGLLEGQAVAGRGLSAGPVSGLGETISAAFDYTWKNYTSAAAIQYQGLPLNERNDQIKQRFGQDIMDITGIRKKYPNPTADGHVKMLEEANSMIDGWIEQGRAQFPEKYMGIKTTKEIRENARKTANISEQYMNEIMIRNPSAISRTSGALIGGIGAAAVDPINAATMFFGAGEIQAGLKGFAAARAIMKTAALEGVINAGVEAMTQPSIAAWQKELGHRYGFGDAVENVGLAFVGGTALSGLIRGTGAVIRRGRDYSGSVSADVLDTIASSEKLPQNVRDAAAFMSRQAHIDESAPPKTIKSAEDLKAHRETAQKVAEDFEAYKTRADAPEKLVIPEAVARVEKTDTPEFKRWFGESKVTEAETGKPMVVYHGTKDNIDAFDIGHINKKDDGWLGRGVYTTNDPKLADMYTKLKNGDAPNIMPMYASIKKPYMATLKEKQRLRASTKADIYDFTEKLKKEGYDGVILDYPDGTKEIVAFDAKQIKSVFNTGKFDPESASLLDPVNDLMPAERMGEPPPLPEKVAAGEVLPERMAIAESDMKALVDELGDTQIALDDGRVVSVADFNEEIQAKKAIIEAMNTCRLK